MVCDIAGALYAGGPPLVHDGARDARYRGDGLHARVKEG
jgi:hypothetical protein